MCPYVMGTSSAKTMKVPPVVSSLTTAARMSNAIFLTWASISGMPISFSKNILSDGSNVGRRVQIMSASVEIQSAGVFHDHGSERNVLDCKDCPMIIDFDEATERECERKIDVVVNSVEPHPHEFGCKELYELCMGLDLWKPGQLRRICVQKDIAD